jgi:hypothetical protein
MVFQLPYELDDLAHDSLSAKSAYYPLYSYVGNIPTEHIGVNLPLLPPVLATKPWLSYI